MTRRWKLESTWSGVGPREPRAVHLHSSRRPPHWTEWVHITLKSQEGTHHGGSGHTVTDSVRDEKAGTASLLGVYVRCLRDR